MGQGVAITEAKYVNRSSKKKRLYKQYPMNLLVTLMLIKNWIGTLAVRLRIRDATWVHFRDGDMVRIGVGGIPWDQLLRIVMIKFRESSWRVKQTNGTSILVFVPGHVVFIADEISLENTLIMIKEQFIDDSYKVKNVNLSGKIVIDIGANIGDSSLLFAGKGALVIAFEPVPSTFHLLERNMLANPELSGRIQRFNVGLADHYEDVNIMVNPLQPGGVSASGSFRNNSGNRETLRLVDSIDFLKSHHISSCDYLKVDCEGCEKMLFKDSSFLEYLNPKSVAIEYHENWHQEIIRFLLNRFERVQRIELKQDPGTGIIYAGEILSLHPAELH